MIGADVLTRAADIDTREMRCESTSSSQTRGPTVRRITPPADWPAHGVNRYHRERSP